MSLKTSGSFFASQKNVGEKRQNPEGIALFYFEIVSRLLNFGATTAAEVALLSTTTTARQNFRGQKMKFSFREGWND